MDEISNQSSSQGSSNRIFIYISLSFIAIIIVLAIGIFSGKISLVKKTLQPAPSITEAPQGPKTYQNRNMGFSFVYPPYWTIKESALRWGSTFSKDNLLITSVDADSELITVSKNNFELIIQAQNKFGKDTCEGIATTVWKYGYPYSFKKLKVLDRDAYRTNIELGALPEESKPKEPYYLPIMFRRLKGEYPKLGSFEDYPNAVTFCFEKSDKDRNLKLKIVYSSSQLTKENIVKKKVDQKSLSEMDEMISSIKLD